VPTVKSYSSKRWSLTSRLCDHHPWPRDVDATKAEIKTGEAVVAEKAGVEAPAGTRMIWRIEHLDKVCMQSVWGPITRRLSTRNCFCNRRAAARVGISRHRKQNELSLPARPEHATGWTLVRYVVSTAAAIACVVELIASERLDDMNVPM